MKLNREIYDEAVQAGWPLSKTIRELGKLPFIPGFSWKVESGRVFVMKRLALLTLIEKRADPCVDLSAIAEEILDDAWVTPLAAVTDWGILPPGYIDAENFRGAAPYAIEHPHVSGRVPVTFKTRSAQQQALAHILAGMPVGKVGINTQNLNDQPLCVNGRFDASDLPKRPLASTAFVKLDRHKNLLQKGFAPNQVQYAAHAPELTMMSRSDLLDIRSLDLDIKSEISALWQRFEPLSSLAARLVLDIPLRKIPVDEYQMSETQKHTAIALRRIYPELKLKSHNLRELYEMSRRQLGEGWHADDAVTRAAEFPLFLLGRWALYQERAIEITDEPDCWDIATGLHIAALVESGRGLEKALEMGSAWGLYMLRLHQRCETIGRALAFFSQEGVTAPYFEALSSVSVDGVDDLAAGKCLSDFTPDIEEQRLVRGHAGRPVMLSIDRHLH